MNSYFNRWKIEVDDRLAFEMDSSIKDLEDNVIEQCFKFNMKENSCNKLQNSYISLSCSMRYLDTSYLWHPLCGTNRQVLADWSKPLETMTSISAPVICLFSEDSQNRYTFALSEIKERVRILFGIHEEDGTMTCKIEIPITDVILSDRYELKLLEDSRNIPYYQTIQHVSKWWETICGPELMLIPKEARMPVYSTWYSYHQNLFDKEIEKECKVASKMGYKSIIIDDGWQTMDNSRGYAFCGDWKMAEGRFENFAAHVKKIHEMGMKYLIWYSVPFVGKKSKVWEKFKDKLLRVRDDMEAGVLDPRYPEIREYLIRIYERAIHDWDLDGLKLDFIDEFFQDVNSTPYNDKMDFISVQDALDFMMTNLKKRLQKIKPDILIEFRQSYIGPNMRKYGNMFRVGDCPASGITNRVGIVDLRLLSGNTAVHSDMLMWHKDEKAEIAALQIINCIFGTVQISIKLDEVSDNQKNMLRFWLKFMIENNKLLQESTIIPYEPQNLYPVIQVTEGNSTIIAVYSYDRIININSELEKIIILNGTKQQHLVLSFEKELRWKIIQKDCYGQILSEKTEKIECGYNRFNVPTAGLLELQFSIFFDK